MELIGIITKPNKTNLEFANKLGLKILIIMSKKLAGGKALIDYHKGAISLEIGPHDRKENVNKIVQIVENYDKPKEIKPNIYKIFDIIKGDKNSKIFINNFKRVKKGNLIAKGKKEYYAKFDFIPIFVGEKSYKNILCLAAKEISSISSCLLYNILC